MNCIKHTRGDEEGQDGYKGQLQCTLARCKDSFQSHNDEVLGPYPGYTNNNNCPCLYVPLFRACTVLAG